MFNLTRRQALATSGGILASVLAPQRFATAAAGNTLNIAYNVNLPSFNPDAGPSSVNPTIQAIYRSIFDQYIGQKPSLPSSRACSPVGDGTTISPRCGWTYARTSSGTTARRSPPRT